MHFLIWETLSFNLIYVAACYLVGTSMCHNMGGLLQHYRYQIDSLSGSTLFAQKMFSSSGLKRLSIINI